MSSFQAILVGDPSFFRIRFGNNPHTRNRWGIKKRVNLEKAKDQWHAFVRALVAWGIKVVVLPPERESPGMVFPANAGFLYPKNGSFSEKRFYLSNLILGRRQERPFYHSFLSRLGYRVVTVPFPFEGEADFIETKDIFFFTCGKIVTPRFVPTWGFPPYKRRYGFRSDVRNLEFLKEVVQKKTVVSLTLVDERFYHGDTVLSPFGPRREHLLAYLPAFSQESQKKLLTFFKERLIPLEDRDAFRFAANSFQVKQGEEYGLVLPEGISNDLQKSVASTGIRILTVDVSEFFEKGGGSIKCLLCDLGEMTLEDPELSEETRKFWEARSYVSLYA